jgi:actin-related protein
MAEYTGEVIYDTPQGKPKPVVNPALVNALVPPAVTPKAVSTPALLSPQDQRAFDLAEAKKKSEQQSKIAEENRATSRKIQEEARQKETKLAEEQRAIKNKAEEIDLKKAKNLENLPTLIKRAKSVLKGESVDETGAITKAPLPTQSLGGSIIDAMGGFVGKTPQGAAQADRLGVIGGAMVLAMPRMEGPQSDADTKLYREMAGKVGDNTISTERRLAALDEVEKIYSKYNKTSGWKVVK